MRRLYGLMVAVGLLSLPLFATSLGAQQVAHAASVPAELDSETLAAVSAEIARARARGLPVEPLAGKVREGRLKRASGALIRLAVAKMAERLDSARVALGTGSTESELVAGAAALGAGADVAALRAVRAASTRPVVAPIGTLAQLVASGVTTQRAVEMIVSLLRRSAAPAQVIALGNLVERDVATGLRPDDAAVIRLRGIEASLPSMGDALTVTEAPGTPHSFNTGRQRTAPKRKP